MLGDAVAEREQTVGKVDVFKENVAAELDVGEVPDALYTEGDEAVSDLLTAVCEQNRVPSTPKPEEE